MPYRVEIEARAAKQIEALQPRLQARVTAALDELAADPYAAPNVIALTGGGYRRRVGDYRIVFDIDDDAVIVLVAEVDHRRQVYRRRR